MSYAQLLNDNWEEILHDFFLDQPTFKLVYITAERLHNSEHFRNALLNLYYNKKLESFVVDEGYRLIKEGTTKFHEIYGQLSHLRDKFTFVPWVVLTATPTQTMKNFLVPTLQMRNVIW